MSTNPDSSIMEAPISAPITFTPEIVQEFAAHPEKVEALSRTDRKAWIRALANQGADQQNAPAEVIADVPIPVKVEAEPAKKEVVAEKPPEPKQDFDVEASKRVLQQAHDEANKWEQKRKALEQKAERDRLKAEEIKNLKVAAPDDFLDENYQADLKATLARQGKMIEQLLADKAEDRKEELESISKRVSSNRENSTFSEIEALQAAFPELKTREPIAKLNAQYSKWMEAAVATTGHKGDLDKDFVKYVSSKYDNDPEFRKNFPIGKPEELDKLLDILEIHHEKPVGGTMTGVYLDRLHRAGKLGERFGRQEAPADDNAARDAARKTVAAMQKQDGELATLAPGDGSSNSSITEEMTSQTAWTFLTMLEAKAKAGEKFTPEEKAKSKLIREKFGKKEV